VHPHITTQDDFFKVHVSRHNKKKELIDAGEYWGVVLMGWLAPNRLFACRNVLDRSIRYMG
jgi:hypothetical protein